MLNSIVIMGRLTRDPDLRHTQSGKDVCSFTVAVDRDYQSKDSQQEKQTDFIDCTAWAGTGTFVSKWFNKGSMIIVDGSLQSDKWTDKNGQNRVSWKINAQKVYFGDSKKDAGSNQNSGQIAASTNANNGFADVKDTEELPF